MELFTIVALVLFIAMVAAWVMLPGSATMSSIEYSKEQVEPMPMTSSQQAA
jgi:hypothetical protein